MTTHRRRSRPDTVRTKSEVVREWILMAAVRLVREGGPSAVTLASVSQASRLRPSSIERSFENVEDILDAVTLAAQEELVELLQAAVHGRTGRAALEGLCGAQRLYAQAHPGMYQAAVRRPSRMTPEAVLQMEAMLHMEYAALEACGAPPQELKHLAFCLRAALRGAIGLESGSRPNGSAEADESFDRLVSFLEAAAKAARSAPSRAPVLQTVA